MISSPLSLRTIAPYSKEELSLVLLGKKNPQSSNDRYVDAGVLADISAERIISNYPSSPNNPNVPRLSSLIYPIILHTSSCNISVLISALAHIDDFRMMMETRSKTLNYNCERAFNLFLGAYMTAARAVHGELSHSTFWARVASEQYSADELCSIEQAFVQVMGAWWGAKGQYSVSVSDDDSDDEGNTLVGSDSDIDIDADNSDAPGKHPRLPTSVAVRPNVQKDKESLLMDMLKMTVTRQMKTIRQRSWGNTKSPRRG